ncbi:MAG: membrane protein insertase YidC [Proteobacteria bacterium]|nr:membrane protein insertase YidC [Pseudomonadota bacterium]
MDKNFLLAFLLSTVAIFTYYTLFPPEEKLDVGEEAKTDVVVEETRVATTPAVKNVVVTDAGRPAVSEADSVLRKTVTVESDLFSIEIDSRDGVLKGFWLKDYKHFTKPHFNITDFVFSFFTAPKTGRKLEYDPDLLVNMAGDISENNRIWKISTGTNDRPVNFHASSERLSVMNVPETLTLRGVLSSGLEIYKTLTFHPRSYLIEMEVKIVNRTGEMQRISPQLNFGAGNVAIDGESLPKPKVASAYIEDSFETYDSGDFETPLKISNPVWAGVMDTYFINAVKTTDGSSFAGEMSPLDSVLNQDGVIIPKLVYTDAPVSIADNQEYNRKFQLFVGPKVQSELEQFDAYLPLSMDLGWFDFLAHPLLAVLRWLQSYVVNWGVAIILLTVIVRTGMFPLAYKGMTSMRKMQQLNPKIAVIREKYKNNKERMNKEVMQFYSQHKINPMGGCLPMVLQIPIFIALYQALLPAIELRHNPFIFWISDLSAPDFTLILPILMGVSMFVQTSLSPNPAMDATQAKIMKWMPVMMVMFFLTMPSGLVLYWVVSNMISVVQQLFFNRVQPIVVEEKDVKGKGKGKTKGKGQTKGKARTKGKK